MGIAMAYGISEDLKSVDYVKCGLDEEIKQSHIQQLNALVAYFYLRGLDYFGGMPIYRGYSLEEVPRSTAKETFDFIEETLKEESGCSRIYFSSSNKLKVLWYEQ